MHTQRLESNLDALESERSALLQRLESRQGEKSAIDALRQQYNQVVYEQWKQKSGIWTDPLKVLPQDVWEMIVLRLLNATIAHTGYLNQLFNLLFVSKTWFQFLIAVPRLWTWVYLDNSQEDELAIIATCLQLSKGCDLSIVFLGDGLLSDVVYPLLSPHTSRITALYFPSTPSFEAIHSAITKLGYLPAVTGIAAFGWRVKAPIFSKFLAYTPSLRVLDGLILDVEILEHSQFAQVTHLRVRLPTKFSNRQSSPRVIPSYITSLNHLQVDGMPGDILPNIQQICAPLTSLIVQPIDTMELGNFLSEIARFEALKYLKISIVHSGTPAPILSNPSIPKLNVRSLDIATTLSYFLSPLTPKLRRELASQDLTKVLYIVADVMPRISSLSVSGQLVNTDTILPPIRLLQDLKKLTIRTNFEGSRSTGPTCAMDTLSSLIWQESQFTSPSHLLSTPVLKNYTFQNRNSIRNSSKVITETYIFPYQCKRTLTRLVLDATLPVIVSLQDLPALEELEFGPGASGTWASDTLEYLISLPMECPSLQRLILTGEFHEWDVLILLLERRNFLQDPSVRRIESIKLPRPLPHKLLWPITRLLGGRFAERRRIEEYSLDVISSLLFHSFRESTCWHCSHLLIQCTHNVTLQYSADKSDWIAAIQGGWMYESPSLSVPSHPPLKEDIKMWLAGKWGRRITYAATFDQSSFFTCRQHLLTKEPTVVTPFSLDGACFNE